MSGQHTPASVVENIHAVVAMEEEQDQQRSLTDKIADGIGSFAGTVTFVLLHLAFFGAWAAANLKLIPGVGAFDPYPFQLLCMLVSLEGVLLSTFVLIKQNRMGKRSDRRNHLDLQINLLTEKEVTKVIQMLEAISAHLDIREAIDAETRELGTETAVRELANELTRSVPDEV